MKIIPTRLLVFGAFLGILAAVLFVAATDAQAHHASTSATGTYWKCKSNGTKSKGTTRVHVHHKKPSRRHMRTHKCVKRVGKKPAAKVQGQPVREIVREVQVVYVPAPASPCQQPCEPKPEQPKPCKPKDPPPPPPCKTDTHKHQQGEGHKKCKTNHGHTKDRDDD